MTGCLICSLFFDKSEEENMNARFIILQLNHINDNKMRYVYTTDFQLCSTKKKYSLLNYNNNIKKKKSNIYE